MKQWLFLIVLIGLFACEEDNDFDPCKSNFDQQTLLENVTTRLIQPSFGRLNNLADKLVDEKDAFIANPNANNWVALNVAYINVYAEFQRADLYASFGPAEEARFRSLLNNFPANVEAIEDNIANGTWDLNAPDAYDRGLPALDYLVFGIAEIGSISSYYRDHPKALRYLSNVTDHVANIITSVNDDWQGNYPEQFIKNTGTAAGSSISQLVNALNQHYENIKRDKVGIPSGVTTLGFTNPTRVEAYYSEIYTLRLLEFALQANRDLFNGFGIREGIGFDDYIIEVNIHRKNDPVDVAAIQNQYQAALAAIDEIKPITLSRAIEENNELVINLYNELVKQIVRIKSDMPEALCVPITYIDNPSDSD